MSLAKRINKKVRALYAQAHDRFHEWWYEFRVRMNWECITSLPQVLKITPPLDENNNSATVILEDDPTNQPGSVDGEGEDEEFSIPLHRSLSRTHFHTFFAMFTRMSSKFEQKHIRNRFRVKKSNRWIGGEWAWGVADPEGDPAAIHPAGRHNRTKEDFRPQKMAVERF